MLEVFWGVLEGSKTQYNTKWIKSGHNPFTARWTTLSPWGVQASTVVPQYTWWPVPTGWLCDKGLLLQLLSWGQVPLWSFPRINLFILTPLISARLFSGHWSSTEELRFCLCRHLLEALTHMRVCSTLPSVQLHHRFHFLSERFLSWLHTSWRVLWNHIRGEAVFSCILCRASCVSLSLCCYPHTISAGKLLKSDQTAASQALLIISTLLPSWPMILDDLIHCAPLTPILDLVIGASIHPWMEGGLTTWKPAIWISYP